MWSGMGVEAAAMIMAMGILAALIALLGGALYVRAVLAHGARPNRATWLVYGVAGACVLASSFAAGGSWSLLVGAAYVIGPIAILAVSLRRGVGGWSPLDRTCLALAALGLGLWWFSGDPRVAVWLHTGVDAIGTVPSYAKAWRDPRGEPTAPWCCYAASSLVNLAAIEHWSVGESVYPLWLVPCTLIMLGILWWRGRRAA
jgi:hypothetical protein